MCWQLCGLWVGIFCDQYYLVGDVQVEVLLVGIFDCGMQYYFVGDLFCVIKVVVVDLVGVNGM